MEYPMSSFVLELVGNMCILCMICYL